MLLYLLVRDVKTNKKSENNQMTAAIIITGSILGIIGIGFSIWSIIDTRKRYNEEYRKGKHRSED